MSSLISLVLMLGLAACAEDASEESQASTSFEVRVESTVEAVEEFMAQKAAGSDWLIRENEKILEVLKTATPESLATPEVMHAVALHREDQERTSLHLTWLADEVNVDALQVAAADNVVEMPIPEFQLKLNTADAERLVIFNAEVGFDWDGEHAWVVEALRAGDTVTVALARGDEVVTVPHDVHLGFR